VYVQRPIPRRLAVLSAAALLAGCAREASPPTFASAYAGSPWPAPHGYGSPYAAPPWAYSPYAAGFPAAYAPPYAAPSGYTLPGAPAQAPAPSGARPAPAPSLGAAAAVAFAYSRLGAPYCWGGEGPGCYDCSGLTHAAWKAGGKAIPRTSSDQAAKLTPVAFDRVEPGDVVWRPGHVGLYVGQGLVIHAPGTGGFVRYQAVDRFQRAYRP
jgi:cell wall-associated NlpC family hydrolase